MFVVDLSFGWRECTGAALTRIGAGGAIGYAGCDDTRKNVPADVVADWLDHGLWVGLVIENVATDARGGASVGAAQGRAIVAAAKGLGYAWRDCVLFGGYDTDSHAGDWPALLAYESAFASAVPVPGYYGDSDSIDYLHARGSADWIFWQSDSSSFSPRNPTPNAHLRQFFNDQRAGGLPVDVNDVERTPLRFMGESMTITDADILLIWDKKVLLDDGVTSWQVDHLLKRAHSEALAAHTAAAAAGTKVDQLAAAVDELAGLVAKLQTGGVDPAALAQALAAHLSLTAK